MASEKPDVREVPFLVVFLELFRSSGFLVQEVVVSCLQVSGKRVSLLKTMARKSLTAFPMSVSYYLALHCVTYSVAAELLSSRWKAPLLAL